MILQRRVGHQGFQCIERREIYSNNNNNNKNVSHLGDLVFH